AQHNASISGAEVGCQGEIGVASAMGAAALATIDGASIEVIDNSAEIALEHQLGLTCDPVGGFVQIPCIERNAKGATFAYNAFLIASCGDPTKHKIGFDCVLQAMLDTGKNMSSCYKETAKGGLALFFPCGS
ncbi:MAG: L-serine ammonia-lyase, iron-sulfur-dependent, subunit alpha, partial [Chlamydiota bacterium]